MPDYSAAELALAGGGTLSVSAFLFFVLQAVKDFLPNLEGRSALALLYALSGIVAGFLIAASTPDWTDEATWLSFVVILISVSITAKGIYTQLFHVKQAGIPPSPDATATRVVDPHAESQTITTRKPPMPSTDIGLATLDPRDPYAEQPRAPIAHARPLSETERAMVNRAMVDRAYPPISIPTHRGAP